jgi:hypothetical protein
MNALPHHRSIAPQGISAYQRMQDQADAHNAAVERLATEMAETYTNDLQIVSECTGDVLFYNPQFLGHHPKALSVLALIRDGNDDAELGRVFREATLAVIRSKAMQDAEDFIAERNDQAAIDRWEALA